MIINLTQHQATQEQFEAGVAVGWITMTVIDYRRLRRVHQRRLSR